MEAPKLVAEFARLIIDSRGAVTVTTINQLITNFITLVKFIGIKDIWKDRQKNDETLKEKEYENSDWGIISKKSPSLIGLVL